MCVPPAPHGNRWHKGPFIGCVTKGLSESRSYFTPTLRAYSASANKHYPHLVLTLFKNSSQGAQK